MTFRFLLSLGAPSDIAEELAQSAWVKGWEHRSQLRAQTTLGAWVNSIAKNLFKNGLRLEQRLEALTHAPVAGIHAPAIDLNSILSRCDRLDSLILHGYYVEGFTTDEIANRVGMCPVAVRVRLHRVRRSLRLRLCLPDERQNSAGLRGSRRERRGEERASRRAGSNTADFVGHE